MFSNLLNTIKQLTKMQWLYLLLIGGAVVILTIFIAQGIYGNFGRSKLVQPNFFLSSLHQSAVIDQIKKVKIDYQQQSFTIVADDNDNWVVLEKANYPVLAAKVKELVFGLADLVVMEPKTNQKEKLPLLQLEDIEDNKNATRVILLDVNNQELASVYLGKRELVATPKAESKAHIFVRKVGDAQAWLVNGRLPESLAFKDLVKQPILDINPANLLEVTLTKPKEAKNFIQITKDPLLGGYKLLNIPPKYELKEDYLLDNLVQQITYLNYDDIIADTADAVVVLEGKVVYAVHNMADEAVSDQPVHNLAAMDIAQPNVAENTATDVPAPVSQVKNKEIAVEFELVYLNDNYYLRITHKLTDNNWLYKISDYACQSLLINKRDLIAEKTAAK